MSITRRQVLQGAAGFSLALPVLPSLLPRAARAAEGDPPRRFIAFATEHGGVWQDHLYPSAFSLTESRPYAGHLIRRGELALSTRDGRSSLSPVLTADASVFTPALASRMNVMRGFDWPFYLGHHRGGHLGNPAVNDGNGDDGVVVQGMPRPTIDQVLAWSDRFYPDVSGILERSLVLGGRQLSTGWSNPVDGSGRLDVLPSEFNSLAVFNRVFRSGAPPSREPVVDLVIEDYRRLRDSDRRLAAGDRRRLDEHMERLFELERKLGVNVSCGDLGTPEGSSSGLRDQTGYGRDPELQTRAWQLMNDVIVAALVCDTCRIVTARCTDIFSDYAGDWHQDIAHQANREAWNSPPSIDGPSPHQWLAEGHQRFFEQVFVDLASKLQAVQQGDGGTLLDACLVQWTHESGPTTHDPLEMPVITAGGACGGLSTGHYADFRNLDSPAAQPRDGRVVESHTGLMMNQWLGTVLQVMGLDRSEFESDGWAGYGPVHLSEYSWYAGYDRYGPDVLGVMGDRVPFVTP